MSGSHHQRGAQICLIIFLMCIKNSQDEDCKSILVSIESLNTLMSELVSRKLLIFLSSLFDFTAALLVSIVGV